MQVAVSAEPSLGNQRGHVAADMQERREAGHATIGEFLVTHGDDAAESWRGSTFDVGKAGADVERRAIGESHQQRAHSAAMPTLAGEVLDDLGINSENSFALSNVFERPTS